MLLLPRSASPSRHPLFMLLLAAIFGALYAVATRETGTETEETARKGIAGVNAAANASLLAAAGQPVLGVAAAGLCAAAGRSGVARDPRFRRILGHASWLMPMSWPVTMVGALTLAGNALAHAVTLGQVERARVHRVSFDTASGTIVTEGGLLVKPGFHGGFNFGGFTFITPGARVVEDHEAGHAFNLAAFGWVFHLIGGWDRKLRDDPMTAYAERLAESNRSPSPRTDWIGHWGRPTRRDRRLEASRDSA